MIKNDRIDEKKQKNYNINDELKIKDIINQLKPYLNSDGGNIDFIKLENNIVYIKLTGACGCCAYRNETIKFGILKAIQEQCPAITDVINVDI
jgi:Fe-S cluster biogenesis protein NfuA